MRWALACPNDTDRLLSERWFIGRSLLRFPLLLMLGPAQLHEMS